jgi:hypothetical protein
MCYRVAADVGLPTIFVTSEEVDNTVWRPRVESAGMDLSLAAHHREVKFTRNPADLEYLDELVTRYDAKLIIVDPLTNHLRGASIHRDEQVRTLFEPYLEWIAERELALLLQMHVLRSVNPKHHPLNVVPAGVVSIAKAIYLFGDHPEVGADENIRVLACPDKFNFGPIPASLEFEYATRPVRVMSPVFKRRVNRDHGYWIHRRETKVTAKMLIVTLAPEPKERKADRAAWFLIELLKDGPKTVAAIKLACLQADRKVAFRTAQRVSGELGIDEFDDENDARKKWWKLSDEHLAAIEEATEEGDELEIKEVDVDIPDTVPEDWADDSKNGGADDSNKNDSGNNDSGNDDEGEA